MNRFITRILPAMLSLMLLMSSCGDPDSFSVKGTVTGQRTMNLRMVYFGEDNINNVLTAARDGVFEFQGKAPADGAVLRILDNDYRPLGDLFVVNGDKIEVTIDPDNPYAIKVKGSEVNERWTEWVHKNARTLATRSRRHINDAVAAYAKANPADIVSALLIYTRFDAEYQPQRALALMKKLAPEARPPRLFDGWTNLAGAANRRFAKGARLMPITYFTTHDSMATFVPRRQKYALVTITNEYSGRTDSILDALRELDPLRKKGKFTILDLSVDTDTLVWRNTTDPDSVNWTRGWIPGSVSAPAFEKIAPQSLPWFVVTDAKGNMLYNGPSLTRAHAVADSVATLP